MAAVNEAHRNFHFFGACPSFLFPPKKREYTADVRLSASISGDPTPTVVFFCVFFYRR